MAIYHTKPWEAHDDPSLYDLVSYHVPCKVHVYIARKEMRFRLYVDDGKGRLPCVLQEGSYKQVDLLDIYVKALEKAVRRAA